MIHVLILSVALACFPVSSQAKVVTVDAATAASWPREAIRAKSFGVSQIIIKGDCRKLGTLAPLEPVNLTGSGGLIGNISLTNCNGSKITNLAIDGYIDCRSNDVLIDNCNWRDWRAQCIRVRYGASRCTIRRCTMIRMPPFATTGDVCAIQFSDGKTLDCKVLECTILNYTDAIQTTDRANPDGSSTQYGYVAGLLIKGNMLGFTNAVRKPDGTSIDGCENALDFKTGGTREKPVTIEGNFLFGVRPNTRNPKGYAITYHRCASDLNISGNIFADCGSAIFNNIQYVNCVNPGPIFVPRVTLQGNVLAATPTLLVGPGKISRDEI